MQGRKALLSRGSGSLSKLEHMQPDGLVCRALVSLRRKVVAQGRYPLVQLPPIYGIVYE